MSDVANVSDVISLIKEKRSTMRPAERRVAEVVLKNPGKAMRFSTAALSEAASVSEPTVSRFCRALGFKGFPELKLKLAQQLATEAFAGKLELDSSDQAEEYSRKVLEAAQSGIGRFGKRLDHKLVELAVELMVQAERLFFFGTGASGPVVMDAVYKFMKLKRGVVGHTDEWSQRMATNDLGPGDTIVCISYTGRTISIVNIARLAREAGARVIAVTKEGAPLAEFADCVMTVEAPEDTEVYLPRHSRLVHFAVIEVLAAGYILSLGPDFRAKLLNVQASLEDTRLPFRRSPKKSK